VRRKVHLHGALGKRFGRVHSLDVATAGEAGRALAAVLPGFRDFAVGKWFRVVRGDRRKGLALGEDDLGFQLGSADLHIVPVLAGAGRNGLGKIIAGVFLIGAAFFFPGTIAAIGTSTGLGITAAQVAGLGVALALTGLGQMLAPKPKSTKDQSSYLFEGGTNVATEGGPVPLVYGHFRVNPVLVGVGLSTEDIAV
jgi:predicted phage tail protein